jgi:hypothetical protein
LEPAAQCALRLFVHRVGSASSLPKLFPILRNLNKPRYNLGNAVLEYLMTDQFAISTSRHDRDEKLPFTLAPGDRITGCFGIWAAPDRIAGQVSNCGACGRRTFRVVTVTSVISLQKTWALCGKHFIASAKVFPELSCTRASRPA